MQKTILGGVLILCALSAQTQTNRNTAPAIYIGAADIQATLKKAPADSVTDQAMRTVGVGNLNVGLVLNSLPFPIYVDNRKCPEGNHRGQALVRR